MGLFRIKPARAAAFEGIEPVADLDRLIADPVVFRWNGKSHLIKPMKTSVFLAAVNGIEKLRILRSQEKSTERELTDAYADLFHSVCDTIGKAEVYEMERSQIGVLFQIIVDCITGKAQVDQAKKKMSSEIPTP